MPKLKKSLPKTISGRSIRDTLAAWALVLYALSGVGCEFDPGVGSLEVERTSSSSTVVRMAVLGEYPSTITRCRLQSDTGQTIWEVKQEDSDSKTQLHQLTFQVGLNQALPETFVGNLAVIFPVNNKGFELEGGKRYHLEVWDKWRRKKSVEFTM